MKLFAELGEAIEKRWRAVNYDETLFPDLAADALREADLPSQISAWDVAAWALGETHLPDQRDPHGSFGEPPVTLFNSSRFHIDVYFWLQSTTAIHQHAFCGAFQVLLGGSLHSQYEFNQHQRINFHYATGTIALQEAEWLQVGDIKAIAAGETYIHSLFHLENPSATIVVRTTRTPLVLPQFRYHKPSLAVDPFFEDFNFIKKRQFVSMLLNTGTNDADELIGNLLQTLDVQLMTEMLFFLQQQLVTNRSGDAQRQTQQRERFENFFNAAIGKHEVLSEILPAVFAQQERERDLISRRNFVTEGNHRFFFALLLNVENKQQIFSLIEKRVPEQSAVETILDWIDELSRTRISGTTDNALGIADFNERHILVLEEMLNGKNLEEIQTEMNDDAAKIQDSYETLKNSTLFNSLWQ